jgi:hypothetical protein
MTAARGPHGDAQRDTRDACSKRRRSILSSEDGRFGEERDRSEGKDERESMSHSVRLFNFFASRRSRGNSRFSFGKKAGLDAV